MSSRKIRFGLISSAAILLGAQGALAGDGGSAFVGGLLGSAIGTAVTNSVIHERRTVYVPTRRYVAPAVNTYQRAENAQIQTALNYFGFNAGIADGVMGANSRAAIGQYQAFIGDPPTGLLTSYEQVFLTSSYQRAVVGSPQDAQIIATSGQGTRSLLIAYRQQQAGAPVQAAIAPPVAVAPPVVMPPATVTPVVVPAAPAQPAEAPAEAVQAAAAPVANTPAAVVEPAAEERQAAVMPTLPTFIAGAATPSMAAVCNRTTIKTNANGGPGALKAGVMLDATQTLSEQFCLARTYAIDDGDSLAATAQGFTADQIKQQCAAFAPSMHAYVARLGTQTTEAATEGLRKFVAGMAIPPAQLSANARICLGVGYSSDDSDVALASALLLVGLDEAAYDELVGYHLLNGFGIAARQDLGLEWIDGAVEALNNGASPLVSANASERLGLLQATLMQVKTGDPAAMVQDAAATTAPATLALPGVKPASN